MSFVKSMSLMKDNADAGYQFRRLLLAKSLASRNTIDSKF